MDESTTRSRHPDSLAQAFLWALLPILVLVLNAPDATYGQQVVITNIKPTTIAPLNLGTKANTVGATTQITGGTRPGNGTNLFHSFDSFTLGTGDVARFQNNMQRPTTNIFARVIGKGVSTIDGTLRTNNPLNAADPMNFGAANLWLVNPSGLLLGPNARVEVGGSVSMSTANYLRFEGTSALFGMLSSPASLGQLSVAPVVAFGFLGPKPPAPITIQGSMLQVPEGQSLSLVGGDITVQAGTLGNGTIQAASLRAPGGQINLVSVASPGEVLVPSFQTGPNINGASFTSFGSVSLASGSAINVSGANTVFIKGGQIVLSVNDAVLTTLTTSQTPGLPETISLGPGSSIVTSNSGADPGADVQLIASNVQMDGASMVSATTGDGPGGNLTIQGRTGAGSAADSVTLSNGATITSQTSGLGHGGEVQITAGTIGLDGAGTTLITQTDGDGNAGNITLNVGTLTLDNGAAINSYNAINSPFGLGQGGNVTVQGLPGVEFGAADLVALTNGSTINTITFGPGRGGDVQLTSRTMTMENRAAIFTGTFDGDGIGGDVVLNVGTVSLMGGSSIESQSQGFTPGLGHGNVTIQGLPGSEFGAAESVTLSGGSSLASTTFGLGDGGQVAITAKSLTMEGADTTVNASTNGEGHGGDIVVSVQQASLLKEATIKTLTGSADPNAPTAPTVTVQGLNGLMADSVKLSGPGSGIISETTGSARSGHVTVESNTVSLTNGAVIQTGTLANVGAGGDVTINAGSVDISSGSRISSLSAAENAGEVAIKANTLILDNVSIETFTSSSGQAGNVVLNVGTVSLSNGAKINSASSGTEAVTNPDGTTKAPGAAGNITITAAGSFTSDASTVATSAEANHSGDISITAQNVQLSGGTLITANSKAPLQVTEIVLIDGQLVPQVVGNGNAGNITIQSGSTFVMNNSKVTTEASQASGGTIEITAPEMVRLIDSRVSTSVAGSATDTAGGDITIDPQFMILQNSQIIAQANAGSGGAINVIAGVFLADPISLVSASSQQGPQGTVNIQSPVQNVGGRLTPLSQKFSSAAALLAQRCAARAADGKFSTFVVAGREGLPVEPGGFLSSPSLTAELLGSSLSGRDPHTQFPAVTGQFPEYDARPIQLAMFGNACR